METADTFNDLYDGMEEAHASIRVDGRDVISRALCSGLDLTREDSDQGAYPQTGIVVRMLASSEPQGKMRLGDKIEIRMDADLSSTWTPLRIRGKMATGGVMRYSLEAEFA